MPKQVCAFLGLMGYYRKFIRTFAKTAKPLKILTHQQTKFEWTSTHHNAFFNNQGISHLSTNIGLPKSKETLDSFVAFMISLKQSKRRQKTEKRHRYIGL